MRRSSLVVGSARELGTVGLVAGLSGFYAAALIMVSSVLGTVAAEAGGAVRVLLDAVSAVFILTALYVAGVVIVNCVATVVAGRLRQIALLRLLGADNRSLRRSVRRSCTRAGLVGAVAGAVVGVGAADVARIVLVARGHLPDGDYAWVEPGVVLALGAVTLCAAMAGWAGSRRVLEVTPAQAMAGTGSHLEPTRRASRWRGITSCLLVVAGGGLVLLAMQLGESGSAAGFVAAFLGAAVSSSGLLLGARFVIPAVVTTLGRLVGRDPASIIARRNAVTDPMRTTRSTLGLVIGVALVTTFAAGTTALRTALDTWDLDDTQREQANVMMSLAASVMICIVVISSIIAAVGFVSTMSLVVIQRRREIGLLRCLGFTRGQVRTMITKESVALSAAAVLFGIALGLVYGAAGAQSLVGAVTQGFVWGVPWMALLVIATAGVVLVLAASRPPARRAVAQAPIEALRVES